MPQKKVHIELLGEYEASNIYTIRFDGESECVFKQFLERYSQDTKFEKDLNKLLWHIKKIGEYGVHERYFRPEGKMRDRVWGLPDQLTIGKLRLYCIRISDGILIIGGGNDKKTRTYQQDPILNRIVEQLQNIDFQIKNREERGGITREKKTLSGNLTFTIKDDPIID